MVSICSSLFTTRSQARKNMSCAKLNWEGQKRGRFFNRVLPGFTCLSCNSGPCIFTISLCIPLIVFFPGWYWYWYEWNLNWCRLFPSSSSIKRECWWNRSLPGTKRGFLEQFWNTLHQQLKTPKLNMVLSSLKLQYKSNVILYVETDLIKWHIGHIHLQ